MVLTALVMVAVNLRIAITSIPAVVIDIKAATGWNDVALGALTTIPVLCMGAFALVVPRLAQTLGRRRTVALAMILLTVGIGSRILESLPGLLYVSAFLAGVGIALSAGLVPGIVREQLPDSVGVATGLWTSALMLGAAAGAAFTVPIALALNSWSAALAVWAIPAFIALVIWLATERAVNERPSVIVRLRDLPWRSSIAWSLTAYLALNSIVFYTAVAWIAPSYAERGRDIESSGWLFGLFTLAQVGAALVLPHLAQRGRRAILAVVIALATFALLAIGWFPDTLPALAVISLGVGLGGGYAVGVGLLSEYSSDASAAARLTAMAFSVTYLFAAIGPTIAGFVLDTVQSWPAVFTLIAIAAGAQILMIRPLRIGQQVQ